MPEIELRLFKMLDSERQSGIAISNYKGDISLVSAKQNDKDQIWGEWCYPQRRQNGESIPSEKVIPKQLFIGRGKQQAIETLKHFINILEGQKPEPKKPEPDMEDVPF